MAKKKSSGNAGLILTVVVLLLGVAAFCMAFLVAVKYVTSKGDLVNEFTGFQSMFGYTSKKEALGVTVETGYLAFSFMSTLAFVLPLVGAGVSVVNNKIAKLVGALLMIAGAVLMFLVPSLVVFAAGEALSTTAVAVATLEASTAKLGIGAIIGGICAGLGGLVAGYAALRK